MKKLIAHFLILMCLLPISIAEIQIFSGQVITDKNVVIDGKIFKFIYDDVGNQVFVQTPAQNLIVKNGECGFNTLFKVCINRANYSDRNVTSYVTYYQIDTTIYKLAGSLTANTTVNPAHVLPNQPANLVATITNPTDFDITKILYNMDLKSFTIGDVTGCSLNGNKLVWNGSLKPKYDKTCTATIISSQEGDYSLVGALSYFNSYEIESKTADTFTLTVLPRQLKVTEFIDQNVEAKQPFYINISLENANQDEKIQTIVNIQLPKNIYVLKSPTAFTKDLNVLAMSSILNPTSITNYSFYFQASSEGNDPIIQTFDYTIKDVHDIMVNDTYINPIMPKPTIEFSTPNSDIFAGQEFIVVAKIKNPSHLHELTDIKAELKAPYNKDIQENLNELKPNQSYAIISNTLVAPADLGQQASNKTIKLNLSIEYRFYDLLRHVNSSYELIIKQSPVTPIINNATNINSSNQSSQKLNQTEIIALQAKSGNKTTQQSASAPATQSINKSTEKTNLMMPNNENKAKNSIVKDFFDKGSFYRNLIIGLSIFVFLVVLIFLSISTRRLAKQKIEDSAGENVEIGTLGAIKYEEMKKEEKPKLFTKKKLFFAVIIFIVFSIFTVALIKNLTNKKSAENVQDANSNVALGNKSGNSDLSLTETSSANSKLIEEIGLGVFILVAILTITTIIIKRKKIQ